MSHLEHVCLRGKTCKWERGQEDGSQEAVCVHGHTFNFVLHVQFFCKPKSSFQKKTFKKDISRGAWVAQSVVSNS